MKYITHDSTIYLNVEKEKVSAKNLPELYTKREECCGCAACYSICPVNAIRMDADVEGFLYPAIDAEKCIKCYKCMSVCVFKNR